jgi:hypothetical protein
MKNEKYQDYESPVVEVVTVEVEKGFATTDVWNPGGDIVGGGEE